MDKRILVDAASPSCLLEETRKLDKHPNKLLEGLNRLRLNKVFCDVILCCEGQEFPCHRVVLASISPYFEAMFTTGMLESTQERVNMDGVEPEVVDMLVSFAYTSEVSISTENVQALLAGADLMDVTDVREACWDYMQHHMNINNCVEIHHLADRYSCKKLEESSMDYILEYFSVIYKQEEFLSVSVDKLTEILSSDRLNVPEEDMVFDAAILWLNKCPDHRLTFNKVLEHIRLPLISPSYLHTVIESLDVVKESQGCQRFISEAKTYQRLISEAEDQPLLSYRNTAHPRGTSVILTMGWLLCHRHDHRHEMRSPYIKSFDPRTKQWKSRPCPYSGAKGPSIIASDMGTVLLYMAGGEFPDGSFSKEMWRYDLHRNTLLQMAPMNKARYDLKLVMLDGYVFAMGGVKEELYRSVKSVERYHPNSNTWELMQSVNMPKLTHFSRGICSLAALDGLIYVLGDIEPVYKYNPITGEWTEVAPMQNHRLVVGSTVCTLNGKIYAIGYQTAEVRCYNPETNQWTMCAPMQKTLSTHFSTLHCSVVMDGKIYVLEDEIHRDIQRYCAETDTWETVGKMHTDRFLFKSVSVRLRNDAPYIEYPADEYDSEDDVS